MVNASTKIGERMSGQVIKTGFWTGVDLDAPDFAHLNDIVLDSGPDDSIFLGDYLHGVCSVAAIALHDIFGYQVLSLYDENEAKKYGIKSKYSPIFPIIHDFCYDPKHRVYIDVRGAISQFDVFVSEFDDFIDDPKCARNWVTKIGFPSRYFSSCQKCLGEDTLMYYYTTIVSWIKAHKDMYMVCDEPTSAENGGKHD